MDCSKIGKLIAKLRKEKGLTQQSLADALGILNKTVSKWECGLGYPDLSYWTDLSVIFGVDISQLMEGEITLNKPDSGNIKRVRFYVCPSCKNILSSTSGASIFCCGRKLDPLTLTEPEERLDITSVEMDTDHYISFKHPMEKDHYILFAASVDSDKVILNRLYPEQDSSLRIPMSFHGKLYLYCVNHGLTVHSGLL